RAELAALVDSLVAAGRMGLYVPLSHQHMTLAMPGTIGGAHYGHTAADPVRGRVYVISNDGPSFYEPMELRLPPDPNAPPPTPGGPGGGPGGGFGGGGPGGAALIAQGETLYQQQCQICHLANRMGSGAAPSLIGLETRMSGADFLAFLRAGPGAMPAFGHLGDIEITASDRYPGGPAGG